uniref:F-box domain-containing protein n=1 Tax=Chenopodium quinoa TaxID=63459 RepID=A0A803NDY3_CHEQI
MMGNTSENTESQKFRLYGKTKMPELQRGNSVKTTTNKKQKNIVDNNQKKSTHLVGNYIRTRAAVAREAEAVAVVGVVEEEREKVVKDPPRTRLAVKKGKFKEQTTNNNKRVINNTKNNSGKKKKVVDKVVPVVVISEKESELNERESEVREEMLGDDSGGLSANNKGTGHDDDGNKSPFPERVQVGAFPIYKVERKKGGFGQVFVGRLVNGGNERATGSGALEVLGKYPTLAPCSKRPSWSWSIPREIMFHIFLFLRASLLQEIVRFVCKEWNAIISDPLFIRAHLLQSMSSPATTGFLIQDDDLDDAKLKQAYYVHPYDRVVSILKLPFEAFILASCNGLLLLQNAFIPKELSVVNLVTKANISLPPLSLTLPKVCIYRKPSAVLAFAPSSGRYKVFCPCFVPKYPRSPYRQREKNDDHLARFEVKVMVWTVAVDETWRAIDIDCQGITMSNKAKQTLLSHPFSIAAGYVYWFDICHSLGFALDIDAETMYQFEGPEDSVINSKEKTYCIPMDTGGAGIIYWQNPSKFWKVWEMIGPKTGPWGRCMNFDAAGMYLALQRHFNPSKFGVAIPLYMSLKTGEFWFFGFVETKHSMSFALVCYNWKTGSVWSPPPRWRRYFDFPHLHVNSLLSLKNL